jgi:hypothetical protein
MNQRIDQLVRELVLDGSPLLDLKYNEATETWWTAVAVEDPTGREVMYELEMQYVEVPDDLTPPYLVVCWVVIPPAELREDARESLPLLRLLDELNGETGAKFRLQVDEQGAASLVCEVDLPSDLITPDLLLRAVERSRDLTAAYFDEIQDKARA